jgi:dTDP-4-dehydrorhamnose reductase
MNFRGRLASFMKAAARLRAAPALVGTFDAVRALVVGAGGQLGSELMRLLPDAIGLTHRELSVTDLPGLGRACQEHRPQVVFNCAAYNAVDAAETEPNQAYRVNSEGAAGVGTAVKPFGVRVVHFSTNFVFDGSLDRPYVESDAPNPLSVYAASKLEGETRLLTVMPEALVIRTAALFGDRGSTAKGGSFPERILTRARNGERIRVVSDQRVNPTYARDLAHAAVELAERSIAGVVHVVAEGCCTWHEFAQATLAESGVEAEVEAVTSSELAALARRPPNGCMGSVRTIALRPWRQGLHEWAARRATGDR